jgi:sulfide dehydrogenase cytochrome subunit
MAVGTAAALPAAAQQADIKILAGTCSGCHGPNGKGSGQIPRLAGHNKDYLIATLKAFKSGERQATVMNRLARGYEEAEITGLADHFSRLKR